MRRVELEQGEPLRESARALGVDRPPDRPYPEFVRGLDPRPIRLALYFPLFADWRVWDYQG